MAAHVLDAEGRDCERGVEPIAFLGPRLQRRREEDVEAAAVDRTDGPPDRVRPQFLVGVADDSRPRPAEKLLGTGLVVVFTVEERLRTDDGRLRARTSAKSSAVADRSRVRSGSPEFECRPLVALRGHRSKRARDVHTGGGGRASMDLTVRRSPGTLFIGPDTVVGMAPLQTPLCSEIGIDHPVVQAPVGSVSTPSLAAAVADAGGLGMLAMSWREADAIRDAYTDAANATDGVVGVNVVLDESTGVLSPSACLDACLDAGAPVVSFSFGDAGPYIAGSTRSAGR